MEPKKTYLGDGLYAEFDGFSIILKAPRESGEHYVALEPDVFMGLGLFAKSINDHFDVKHFKFPDIVKEEIPSVCTCGMYFARNAPCDVHGEKGGE